MTLHFGTSSRIFQLKKYHVHLEGMSQLYGVGIVVLPLSMGWIQEDPYMANIVITGVYATVSFVRSYFLRRIFEKYGVDDNFIRLAKRGITKLIDSVK
jgi:hypothetical protein